MFKKTNDNETDFCESYKSQILGNDEPHEGDSLSSAIVKIVTILILLVTITGLSFYGYNYFTNTKKITSIDLPSVSIQAFDQDLVVKTEEKETNTSIPEVVPKSEKKIPMPTIITSQIDEEEIDEVANNVKIAIAKSELEEENETKLEEKIVEEIHNTDMQKEKSLEVPTSAPEAEYLEELAKLSDEIDKKRNH